MNAIASIDLPMNFTNDMTVGRKFADVLYDVFTVTLAIG